MKSIEWIILVTEHYDDMKTFYTNTLGFTIERDVPEEEFTQFKLDNCFIAIYGRSFTIKLVGDKFTSVGARAIYSFGQSRDIDSDYQQLKAKGVQFMKTPETHPWGQRTAYFTDPDGNIWEIQQWLNK